MLPETETPRSKPIERVVQKTTTVHLCPVCERPLRGRSDKVFCGDACRQRAYYRRRRSTGGPHDSAS